MVPNLLRKVPNSVETGHITSRRKVLSRSVSSAYWKLAIFDLVAFVPGSENCDRYKAQGSARDILHDRPT